MREKCEAFNRGLNSLLYNYCTDDPGPQGPCVKWLFKLYTNICVHYLVVAILDWVPANLAQTYFSAITAWITLLVPYIITPTLFKKGNLNES